MENQKDFFGKVADVAGDMADSIAKTATELYQQGKTQVSLARLRSELRNHYRQLGAIVYALERGDREDDGSRDMILVKLDELCNQIHEIELARDAEKQAKSTERDARQATRSARTAGPVEVRFESECCAACGQSRVGVLPFCAHCGEKFS